MLSRLEIVGFEKMRGRVATLARLRAHNRAGLIAWRTAPALALQAIADVFGNVTLTQIS
jgi:hypothetical protein